MTADVEHLMLLVAIHVSSLEKCLFQFFAHFKVLCLTKGTEVFSWSPSEGLLRGFSPFN